MAFKFAVFTVGLLFLFAVGLNANPAPEKTKTGSLKGTVVDAETQAPLVGATVLIVDTERGAATDDKGEFKINNVPVGSYSVAIRSIGYQSLTRTDVILRSGRITVITADLILSSTEVKGLKAVAGFFLDSPTEATSGFAGLMPRVS